MVSNLPYAATVEDVEDFAAQAGTPLNVKIITDRETGRSKGYGFVSFADPLEATYAIERLNGAQLMGRPITVRPAIKKPMVPRERPSYSPPMDDDMDME
jgi:RNA recognition motif-containing protein